MKSIPLQFDLKQDENKQTFHNTAVTSRESFKQLNKSGQRQKEKAIVFEVIQKYQPVTSRMLSQLTGIERTNVTRTLFDLVHETPPQVKEAFISKCQTTKKSVKYYTLINWKKEVTNA